MHLIRRADTPYIKNNTEDRRYYLPDRDPLEVIETEMRAGGCQEAHSHEVIREAMLVLEGLVCVEEMVADITSRHTLAAGDFVVFDRGVPHRIANAANTVARTLHFKFIGDVKDRVLFATDKNSLGPNEKGTPTIPDIYTQDYRHFDNLIWQVPAWASAIFGLAITASVLVLANGKAVEAFLPTSLSATHTASIFLFSIFFVLILLTNVFLRFRLHQRVAPRPHRRDVPALWFMISGQTSLLLVLFVEAAIVFCFAFVLAGAKPSVAHTFTAALFVPTFIYVEWSVRRLSARLKLNRDSTNPKG